MENQQYIELDVREDLEQKIEPFDKITGALKELQDGQGLIIHTIFNPAPLYKVMERKGFDNKVEQINAKHWKDCTPIRFSNKYRSSRRSSCRDQHLDLYFSND
jgi:hypothetical protein